MPQTSPGTARYEIVLMRVAKRQAHHRGPHAAASQVIVFSSFDFARIICTDGQHARGIDCNDGVIECAQPAREFCRHLGCRILGPGRAHQKA